ncbi:MAG: nucleoside kinase [Anaerolineae bacterium]|nr:nucleoside kinase [Anaerolineae bacterium]
MTSHIPLAPHIRLAAPRDTVQVRLDDGRILEGPVHAPLEAFVTAIWEADAAPVVAALVDGELRELTYPVRKDVDVRLLSNATSDGKRIYQRSLTLLMLAAVHELYPEARIRIEHAVTMTGLLCEVQGRPPFTPQELVRIQAHMQEIVDQDQAIVKRRVPLAEAKAIFGADGYEDKVRLLDYRDRDYLVLYSLCGVDNYFYGYMVPSTRYLPYFDLVPHPLGFVLRAPRRGAPVELPSTRESPKLDLVFQQYGEWLHKLHIADVSALNDAVASGRIREVILVSEALHEQQVVEIAARIAARRDEVRLVLVAGPSCSGKTTFSRRLAIQLMVRGLQPAPLEMDNYFVDRDHTPRDENGELDFEHLGALDLELLNANLLDLMAGREVRLPSYDFRSGTRQEGETLRIGPQHVIIAEGIHGMNPDLVRDIPPQRIYRIYISALTQLNIDCHNRVSTTDSRLLRRILRDAQYRGYSAAQTIDRWESVHRGEVRWIFPYQENADAMINSALAYELAVIKPLVEPYLRHTQPGTLAYVESKRLLSFLQWISPCTPDLVPDNSLLREFIGGSILRDLKISLGQV